MLEQFQNNKNLLSLFEKIKEEKSILIDNIFNAPKALIIYLLSKYLKKDILVLSKSNDDKLFEDLSYFSEYDILEFSAWENLFDENISISPDIIGQRMQVLNKLSSKNKPAIIISSLFAALQKTISKEDVLKNFILLKTKKHFEFEKLEHILTSLGYTKASVVTDKKDYAIRGGIIDVFITSESFPVRIEFFGDEIDNIRTFDPISQKSINKIDQTTICPADEIKNNTKSSYLIDHLQNDPIIVFDDLESIEDHIIAINKFSSSSYVLSINDFFKRIENLKKLYFSFNKIEELSEVEILEKSSSFESINFEFYKNKISAKRFYHPFLSIYDFFNANEDDLFFSENFINSKSDIYLISSTEKEEENFKNKINKNIKFERGYISSSFGLNDFSIFLLSSTDFTHHHYIRRKAQRASYHTPLSEFHNLSMGDLVVHYHSGIGKYLGTEKQTNHLGQETEFLVIEYAENSKLFVPISQAHLVSRYIGTKDEKPQLNAIGSTKWQSIKSHAQKQIIGYASDLLNLYAERSIEKGFIFLQDNEDMKLFEMDFPYTETQDQMLAIDEIKNDMQSEKSMERLICGDVGYGKTEVAMRAAFKAISCGKKQVVVLVPTTVLAMQHYDTFKERMANFAVNIEMISRFNTAKINREIIQRTKEGQVDILIGTHRLLSKDVEFKDLGLIIIDEEQRFGVRAKEHLKKLKKGVDSITLSATPIPRTLYMSLIKARDMSVINTPPQDRLPIKTIIIENDDSIIKNALLRELSREGQAFIIHNSIETIYKRQEHINKLIPEAKTAVVHGQMDSDQIDVIFHKFKNKELNILFSTTIVENGVDIPNANTIIIDNSHKFGLSDLYQLRGRVGRWNKPAYAYLVIPKNRQISEISQKRLNALMESSGYGGGMKVALRDLEIRGAGDILGVKQSGQVSAIGFHLYCKLLKRAVESIKQKKPISFIETKLDFSFDAKIPEDYIKEPKLRMEIYYRLGEANSFNEINTILDEIKDRFGKIPKSVELLYHLMKIKVFCSLNQITSLKFDKITIIAEQKKGKKLLKKSLPLPSFSIDLDTWEAIILERLTGAFYCKNMP